MFKDKVKFKKRLFVYASVSAREEGGRTEGVGSTGDYFIPKIEQRLCV